MRKANIIAMQNAGALMANAMFNLAQRTEFTQHERDIFKKAQTDWDAAVNGAAQAPRSESVRTDAVGPAAASPTNSDATPEAAPPNLS